MIGIGVGGALLFLVLIGVIVVIVRRTAAAGAADDANQSSSNLDPSARLALILATSLRAPRRLFLSSKKTTIMSIHQRNNWRRSEVRHWPTAARQSALRARRPISTIYRRLRYRPLFVRLALSLLG